MTPDRATVVSAVNRDGLQPSLFDRLSDEMAGALARLHDDRRALGALLDEAQARALAELLADDRLDRNRVDPAVWAKFAGLSDDARGMLDRVLQLELSRRAELRRTVMLSSQQLRRSVLRDLESLLNTTAGEVDMKEGRISLDAFPTVRASVLNYGVPALSGHVRTAEDVLELALGIEASIRHYEPRVRQVRVRVAEAGAPAGQALASPLELIIEGELWGYPIAEHLLVRTVLDLDAGRVEVSGTDRAA